MSSDDVTSLGSVRAFLERARASSGIAAAARIEMAGTGPVEAAGAEVRRWRLDELMGRMVELSGLGAVASLTAAVGVVLEAQVRGEPVAWIGLPQASFYPPDVADAGVDLDALVVVRAPDPIAMVRAADRLLRSGGFGLVVLDLGPAGTAAEVPIAVQGRLVGLAQHHDAALLVLTEKTRDAASLGSMVSLRAEAVRERVRGGFEIAVRAIKDKRRGPGWSERAEVIGPAGLPGHFGPSHSGPK